MQSPDYFSLCPVKLSVIDHLIFYTIPFICLQIPRYRLRNILHQHDETGVTQRRLGRLHRRVYHVQCPNHTWHVDTNHKLIRWCFVISGAVDGFSRLVTVLHCLDNNRANSLLEVFIEGTERFGTPHRVRTDMGMENLGIANFMIEKRGVNGKMTGKSTHNQRIERLWRDVYDGVLVYYYQLFSYMEDENILVILNPLHIYALHYVFKDKINEKLNIWREAWGSHRLRTVGTSPMRMWYSGVMSGTINTVNFEHNHDGENNPVNPPNNERPVFQPDHPEISEECLLRLSLECPSNWVCPNFGINVYQRALSIISEFITLQ